MNNFWGAGVKPLAIAHRGGNLAGKHQENTLEAFSAAQQAGFQYVETDAILAASGEVVLFHGAHNYAHASLSRGLTRKALQSMTLTQMRQTLKVGGSGVPALTEALRAFPKIKFVLDLKTAEAAG